jgi:hypothetical protein
MISARALTPLLVGVAALACAGRPARDGGPPPAPAPERTADLPPPGAAVHHELRVALHPDGQRLEVEDAVTLSPALRARLGDAVVFSLHAGLSPARVGPGAPLAPSERGPASRAGADEAAEEGPAVPLETFAVSLAPGERRFTVRYGGRIFHPVREGGEEYARKSSYSPGLVSAEGAVLSGATHWVPYLSEDLVAFAVEARVPAGWEVVSQGARTRREADGAQVAVRWESPEPQDEPFLVAAPLVERSRGSGRVLVQTFLRSDDAALSDAYLAAGERYLAMYERLLGPYPYPKFALVENFWETGYGMPSFTLLGSRVIRLPFILHSSYPHEILHNWWGNGVFVDARRGNWCEGLTAYLADHLVQEQRGRGADHRRTSLQRYADYVAESQDLPVKDFRERHGAVTQAIGYDKVMMVFHMLRERLGDARFVAGLRRFYEEQRFRAASFDDLGRALGAAAGEDLAPWLSQWLERPGAPAIRLEAVGGAPRAGGWALEVTLAQAQEGEAYAVDVPVVVTLPSAPGALRRTVRLAERRQRFTLEVPEAPSRVDVDPEFDVFRRLDPREVPPALSGAFGAARRVLVLPASAPAEVRRAYAALAGSWAGAGTEVVTDADLSRVPAGKAVWVLGWENRLRPAVAEGLRAYGAALTGEGLRAGTASLSRAAHSVVVTVRSPADPAQVVAFVGADRPAAVAGLARKLPHYGRYGLLGFEGDEPANVAKDVWPVVASPMAAAPGGGELPPRAALPARRALAEPDAAAAR